MASTNSNDHEPQTAYARHDYEGLQSVDSADPRSGLQPVTPTPPYEKRYQSGHHDHTSGGYHSVSGTSPHQSPMMTAETAVPSYPHQYHHHHHLGFTEAKGVPTTTGTRDVFGPGGAEDNNNPKTKRILGMRKTTFFLLASNILLAIALVLVGVLPAQLYKKDNAATADKTGTTGNGTASSNSNMESSFLPGIHNPPVCFNTTTPSPRGTPPGNPRPECPLLAQDKSNYYTVPRTTLTFSRLCNTDYPDGDMGRMPALTMQDCLAFCAQLNLFPSSVQGPCVGVTWVYDDVDGGGPQGQGISYCFPKNATGKGVTRAGTESAFLVI